MMNSVEALWAFRGKYSNNNGVRKHKHDYYQIYYITYGVGNFIVNNKEIVLSKNMFLIVRPFEEHELERVKKDKLEVFEAKFNILSETLIRYVNSAENHGICQDEYIKSLFERLIKEGLYKHILYQNLINNYLYSIILLMLRDAKYDEELAKDIGIKEISPSYDKLSSFDRISLAVVNFISDHYMRPINLDDIARNIGYNKYYLCQTFKQSTGRTIGEYIQYVRVEKAVEYLIHSPSCNLQQLSDEIGFGSTQQFCKIFKKFTKFSPNKYRKMLQKQSGKEVLLTDMIEIINYSYEGLSS